MKIAQIAPLIERCPPKLYGGTERIVSYLTEELVRRGHDVTLFASGDSKTSARLISCSPIALRLDPSVKDPLPYHLMMLEEVRRYAEEFDILHFHIDLLQGPLIGELNGRTVTTLHGRLDLPDLKPFYETFPDMPLVSISNDQRSAMPPVNWAGTIYHGLPRDLLHLTETPRSGYLAFIGRISPEKGVDRAIEIAVRAGEELRIAAKIDKEDQNYWDETIAPLVDKHDNVVFVGEIGEEQKAAFLGNARALLFPIDWAEPFGLVMIEAMACGTPSIAFRCGSVPEVIDEGVTGFVVDDVDQAVAALRRVGALRRPDIRAVFEKRFSVERMTDDYLETYRKLLAPQAAGEPKERTAERRPGQRLAS